MILIQNRDGQKPRSWVKKKKKKTIEWRFPQINLPREFSKCRFIPWEKYLVGKCALPISHHAITHISLLCLPYFTQSYSKWLERKHSKRKHSLRIINLIAKTRAAYCTNLYVQSNSVKNLSENFLRT